MNAIHAVPAPCPKCARGHLQGPRYRKGLLGREVLLFTCDVCGYEQERETADAEPKEQERAW